jgi:alkylhydroperoxidase family enzyme
MCPAAVWDRAAKVFDEKELIHLMFAITSINSWNRLSITARLEPRRHEPGTLAQAA